jgi:hypothetical protein
MTVGAPADRAFSLFKSGNRTRIGAVDGIDVNLLVWVAAA